MPDGVRMTQARQAVLDVLARAEPRATSELARAAEVSGAVVRGMEARVELPGPQP